MPVVIHRYKCEWCKKHYSTKSSCERHEFYCYWNPVNRTCSTCVHFSGVSLLEHKAGFRNACAIDKFEEHNKTEFNVLDGDWFRDCDSWAGYVPDLVGNAKTHLDDLDLIDATLAVEGEPS